MIARYALLGLLPFVAIFSLTRKRRILAVIGMGLLGLIMSALYLLLHAPDVALTEAAIGAALVTFIYVLAIRKTGRLMIVGDEVPGLLKREGEQIVGLEQEILVSFCQHLGLDLVIRLTTRQEAMAALKRGEADIAAGGIVPEHVPGRFLVTPGFLPTALFRIAKKAATQEQQTQWNYFSDVLETVKEGGTYAGTLDLARFLPLSRLDLSGYVVNRLAGSFSYSFLLPQERKDLHRQLSEHLSHLRESGKLEEMIRRYFP